MAQMRRLDRQPTRCPAALGPVGAFAGGRLGLGFGAGSLRGSQGAWVLQASVRIRSRRSRPFISGRVTVTHSSRRAGRGGSRRAVVAPRDAGFVACGRWWGLGVPGARCLLRGLFPGSRLFSFLGRLLAGLLVRLLLGLFVLGQLLGRQSLCLLFGSSLGFGLLGFGGSRFLGLYGGLGGDSI